MSLISSNPEIKMAFLACPAGDNDLEVGTVTYCAFNGSSITSSFSDHDSRISIAGLLKIFKISVITNASTVANACDILINSAGAIPSLSITALTTGTYTSSNQVTIKENNTCVYRLGASTVDVVTIASIGVLLVVA